MLIGCRIAKHKELVEPLKAKLNYLLAYYKKAVMESTQLNGTALAAASRFNAKAKVQSLSGEAITKLDDLYKLGMKTIQEDQVETVLALCLRTLGDMQTAIEDYVYYVLAIREFVSNF